MCVRTTNAEELFKPFQTPVQTSFFPSKYVTAIVTLKNVISGHNNKHIVPKLMFKQMLTRK